LIGTQFEGIKAALSVGNEPLEVVNVNWYILNPLSSSALYLNSSGAHSEQTTHVRQELPREVSQQDAKQHAQNEHDEVQVCGVA
jgi:hypothetical protein